MNIYFLAHKKFESKLWCFMYREVGDLGIMVVSDFCKNTEYRGFNNLWILGVYILKSKTEQCAQLVVLNDNTGLNHLATN